MWQQAPKSLVMPNPSSLICIFLNLIQSKLFRRCYLKEKLLSANVHNSFDFKTEGEEKNCLCVNMKLSVEFDTLPLIAGK